MSADDPVRWDDPAAAELWEAFLERGLDPRQAGALEALLQSRPDLRELAADLYQEDGLCRLAARLEREDEGGADPFAGAVLEALGRDGEDFARAVDERVRPAPTLWPRYGMVAAATLALTLGAQFLLVDPPGPAEGGAGAVDPGAEERPAAAAVATLVSESAARWAGAAVAGPGSRLRPGRYALREGSVLLRFDGGAALVLEAGAEVELLSRSAAALRRGEVTVYAPEEAYGFVLRTPGNEIIDLGTEFHVSVSAAGSTSLEVLQGEVESGRNGEAGGRFILTGGEGVRLGPGGAIEGRFATTGRLRFRQLVGRFAGSQHRAGLLAHEPFSYPAGTVALGEAAGGSGWAEPWRVREGVEVAQINDRSTGLPVAPREEGTAAVGGGLPGGALRIPGIPLVRLRRMAAPIDLGRDGETYLSFLTRRDRFDPASGGRPRRSVFRFTLREGEDYWATALSFQLPPAMRPQIGNLKRGNRASPARFGEGETLLWVVRVAARARGEDRVSLRVYSPDETVDPLEPAVWSVEDTFRSGARLDLALVTGTGPQVQWFDELRVGTTWASVTERR